MCIRDSVSAAKVALVAVMLKTRPVLLPSTKVLPAPAPIKAVSYTHLTLPTSDLV